MGDICTYHSINIYKKVYDNRHIDNGSAWGRGEGIGRYSRVQADIASNWLIRASYLHCKELPTPRAKVLRIVIRVHLVFVSYRFRYCWKHLCTHVATNHLNLTVFGFISRPMTRSLGRYLTTLHTLIEFRISVLPFGKKIVGKFG